MNKLADYTYDAWGNAQSKTETSSFTNNPLRYCGEYYDYEISVYMWDYNIRPLMNVQKIK